MSGAGYLLANVGILILLSCVTELESLNITKVDGTNFVTILNRHGEPLLIDEHLMRRLSEEDTTWHWTPWLRTRTQVQDGVVMQGGCGIKDSVDSFPEGIFTDEQLRQGAFLLYMLFGIYAFTLLAIVCNDYFLPCVELICEDLKIPQNIAAATFMSVATSCPEFFVNVISTFLTGSAMGIGTIVGSAIFNLLGVAAIGSLAAIRPIPIEAKPVTRDVMVYMVNVSVLVTIVWDGQIDWQEAVVLGVMYILYFVFMFNSIRVFNLVDKIAAMWCKKNKMEVESANNPEYGFENKGFEEPTTNINFVNNGVGLAIIENVEESKNKPEKSLFRFPKENSKVYRFWWLYTWPLKLVLTLTIPSPITYRRFYPVTFIMCIVWIGTNSYFVSWSMTVLGHTFFIPESVMGMTFLAFGGCLPEAISIFIMSRKGEGGIGVSNALGANSLAILFALGMPWLIRTLTLVGQGAEDTSILLDSSGIDFIVGSLLVGASLLWLTLFFGKFKLRRGVGIVLISLYLFFITFAILVELGIILDRSIMRCLV